MINGTCFCCSVVITGLTCNWFHAALMLFFVLESFAPPVALLEEALGCVFLSVKQIDFRCLNPECSENCPGKKRAFLLQMTDVSPPAMAFACALEFLIHLL